jgi:hypothetical protein
MLMTPTDSEPALQYAGSFTLLPAIAQRLPLEVVMVRRINLESLADMAPALSRKLADAYAEGCMVCLDLQEHRSGVDLDVEFEGSADQVQVTWDSPITDQIRRAHGDLQSRVEKGAYAIALLLLPEFRGLYAVEVSLKWNGIDFYLSPEPGDDRLIFNDHTAVLEVSGIQSESSSNSVRNRINGKMNGVAEYKEKPDYKTVDLPHYYCVVEFSRPLSVVVRT